MEIMHHGERVGEYYRCRLTHIENGVEVDEIMTTASDVSGVICEVVRHFAPWQVEALAKAVLDECDYNGFDGAECTAGKFEGEVWAFFDAAQNLVDACATYRPPTVKRTYENRDDPEQP